MKQETFIMLKPDAYASKNASKVKKMLNEKGFVIESEKELKVDMNIMTKLLLHYQEVIDRLGPEFNFVGKLFNSFYFCKQPKIGIMRVSCDENVIVRSRELIGTTEPVSAKQGTIRHLFSNDSYELAEKENRLIRNVIHASDSLESAKKEIKIWKEYL